MSWEIDGWIGGLIDGWVNLRLSWGIDAWIGELMDGWVDECMEQASTSSMRTGSRRSGRRPTLGRRSSPSGCTICCTCAGASLRKRRSFLPICASSRYVQCSKLKAYHEITPWYHKITPLYHEITPLYHEITPLYHEIIKKNVLCN